MSGFFSRLFGGGGAGASPSVKPEEYKGYRIYPEPIREGSRWRIAARIEKDVGGETKVHQLIRADTLESEDSARAETMTKAQMVIDQLGDSIFD